MDNPLYLDQWQFPKSSLSGHTIVTHTLMLLHYQVWSLVVEEEDSTITVFPEPKNEITTKASSIRITRIPSPQSCIFVQSRV